MKVKRIELHIKNPPRVIRGQIVSATADGEMVDIVILGDDNRFYGYDASIENYGVFTAQLKLDTMPEA